MTTDIATIAAQLDEAKQNAALWERLSNAGERVKQLTRDYDKAKAAKDKADGAEAHEEKERRFSRYSDIQIRDVTGAGEDAGVLKRSYEITYTAPQYDMYAMKSFPERHIVQGFDALKDDLYELILERHSDKIPGQILALAPGNAAEALSVYLQGKRRGYLTGAQ
jgi:hypothetical protein